jgi:lysophospholipase L1-like esterase
LSVVSSTSLPPRRFERYVAIGDSSTEGLIDPDGAGGYRGWSMRLAERIARAQGSLLYANLAVRGRTTREIRETQLAPALGMRPDLVTVFSGTNDVIAPRFDPRAFARDAETLQRRIAESGATVLTFTLPDLTPLMPLARLIAPRIRALNDRLREAASRTGTRLVDFAAFSVATDRRLWNEDRIHANAAGHARIAEALAHALGLPGADDAWQRPLPDFDTRTRADAWRDEWRWVRGHFLPWLLPGVGGPRRPKGAGPKRPALAPVEMETGGAAPTAPVAPVASIH